MLGVGGGLIFTPLLFFLFQSAGVAQPVLWTIASSLFCTFVAASTSVYRQYRLQNIHFKESLLVGLLGVSGTWIGKQIITSPFYKEQEFSLLFSALLLFTSYKFLRSSHKKNAPHSSSAKDVTLLRALGIGAAGGFVATLAGIGGGLVMVPLMTLFFALPHVKAVSVSSFAIVIISLAAFVQLGLLHPESAGITSYSLGFIDLGAVFPLAIGALLGANLGVLLTGKLPKRLFELFFAVLTFVVALRMVWGIL